jgi:hypothetical protein
VSTVFTLLLLAALALLAAAAARGRPDARRLVLAALASVVAFAVLGRVLSPQFLIWVVPLAALAFAWRAYALAAASAAAIVLTQVEFPGHYFERVAREPFPSLLVALRDVVLLAVLALAVRELGPLRLPSLSRRAPAAARST